MKKIFLLIGLSLLLATTLPEPSYSQCALCKINAENDAKSKNSTAGGINIGILYLLVIPYALVGGLGYYWYWKNKKPKPATDDLDGMD